LPKTVVRRLSIVPSSLKKTLYHVF
jgi:hypothetical protein